MFSIVILTYNEQDNLADCLDHISWCDDIIILDSFSTDKTLDVAKKYDTKIVQRKFDDFAGQRNYALDNIELKYEWVFHLDVDELFTNALLKECKNIIKKDENGAYLVPSKMILWDTWLKYSATYPVYQMRFHKLGDARFKQVGHGQRETDLKRGLGILKEPYEHHSFQKGLSHWFDRHNKYSTAEAEEAVKSFSQKISYMSLFKGGIEARRVLKQISFKLPFRHILKFIYMYFLKLGFLDGKAGLAYCSMHSVYEKMVAIKIKEIQMQKK